jgi:outer membrane lipoprotein-sorting protein
MLSTRTRFLSFLVLVVVAVSSSAAETLDEVVEKHIDARGGRDAWEAIESLEITGSYTSFSNIEPFTLTRQRDHRIRFDSAMEGNSYVAVYDGEKAWSVLAFAGLDWAQPMSEPDFVAFRQEIDFATPLFDYKERGIEAELIGESEIDGTPAIAIKLTRPDGQEETWYLDPQTYLEIGRESQGSDFGRPTPQRSFYDDYRQVEGVKIPFYTETQWYTRHRIYEVESVTVNPEVDEEVFAFPPSTGMSELASLAGSWNIKVEHRDFPQAPWAESERSSVIDSKIRGGYLQETYVTKDDVETVRTLSYDRFRKVYRLTQISSFASYLDIQEGGFDEGGRLVLTNSGTGTTLDIFGMTLYERLSLFDLNQDSFEIEQEISSDGGETWNVLTKLHYIRAED